jgi:cytochrome c biogenesis protein CcmG/thiol:disulfide interchange protein DsbE
VQHPARWVALTVAVVVAAFGVVLATQVSTDPTAAANKSQLVGKPVPDFTLHTFDGHTVSSSNLTGKAVIVNFWNTWCLPCQQELPALKDFYREHATDPDFEMVGIVRDAQKSKSAIADYVRQNDMGWTIALDPGARAALDFATRGQPETFAITPDGRIVGFQLASVDVGDLEAMLAAARGQR